MNDVDATARDNPLLDFSGLPRFAEIGPEHVAPAIDALLDAARATLERVATTAETPTWDTFVQPLSDALDRLDRAWAQVRPRPRDRRAQGVLLRCRPRDAG
jgi:oligopeptidase A